MAGPSRQVSLNLGQSLGLLRELQRARRIEEARDLSAKLVAFAPDHVEVLHLAAISELMAGRPDLALPPLERALSFDGGNVALNRLYAATLKALGRTEDVIATLERTVALLAGAPTNLDVRKFNRESTAHHVQHRPVDHVYFRKSMAVQQILTSFIEQGSADPDDLARAYCLIDNVQRTLARGVPGALAELGVYRGASARVLKAIAPGRMLYLFDPFDGSMSDDMPAGDRRRTVFKDTSLDQVKAYVGTDEVVYCPGMFPQTAKNIPSDLTFAVVHLDCDTALPTRAGLEFFYPRLSPGGLLIVHDYLNDSWPGVAEAVDEFMAAKPEGLVVIPDKTGTGILVKTRPPA